MSSHFFAMLSRMKYIDRWSLMRNTRTENLSEHSFDVAILSHALATITNNRFHGNIDVGLCVLIALYHDASEILTGDMPTPVKYHNPEIQNAYKQVEKVSSNRLIEMLPNDLKGEYSDLFFPDVDMQEYKLVKAADKLSALVKCMEEKAQGNPEFNSALISIKSTLKNMNMPAVDCFLSEFLPAYELSLDELDN